MKPIPHHKRTQFMLNCYAHIYDNDDISFGHLQAYFHPYALSATVVALVSTDLIVPTYWSSAFSKQDVNDACIFFCRRKVALLSREVALANFHARFSVLPTDVIPPMGDWSAKSYELIDAVWETMSKECGKLMV